MERYAIMDEAWSSERMAHMDEIKHPPTLQTVRLRRAEILALAERFRAYNIRLFGSVARDEATIESDIDFLVDFDENASLWDAIGLWRSLSELLGYRVNVIAEEVPADGFMQRALKDAIPL